MKVIPIGDKIIVKRVSAEETTAGGIVLPDSAQEKSQEGRVVSLGEGRLTFDGTRIPFTVQEGDRILFTSYAGTDVEIDGEELLIMTEEDILAIIG